MNKILELYKANKKMVIGIVVVVLGYLGYDNVAEQVKSFAGEPTEIVVSDSTSTEVDSTTVVIDSTIVE